jgi:hypothetical protein
MENEDTNNISIIIDKDDIELGNNKDQDNIEDLSDEHFTNKLNETLKPFEKSGTILNEENLIKFNEIINSKLRSSNSPITLSKSSSEVSIDTENSSTNGSVGKILPEVNRKITLLKSNNNECSQIIKKKGKKFRKLSFKEVERTIDTFESNNKISNELDILITYLNGQKNLYIHSKNFTSCKLNLLMVPTLFLSTCVTIISPFICMYGWSNVTISILNATITLLISLVNYFKLESSLQMYSHMASQYDKLLTILEMANGRLLFLDDEGEQNTIIKDTLREFKEKIYEIKDTNNNFIPEDIKSIFPIISHINVFSFIKRIETYKKSLIYKYCDTNNELRYILFKTQNLECKDDRTKQRIIYLINLKNKLRDEFLEYKGAYTYMDDAFIQEIKNAEEQKFWCIRRMTGYKPKTEYHSIIKKNIPKL